MPAHDARDRAFVGQRERGIAQRLRALDQFLRVRRAAQEREIGEAVQFGVGGSIAASQRRQHSIPYVYTVVHAGAAADSPPDDRKSASGKLPSFASPQHSRRKSRNARPRLRPLLPLRRTHRMAARASPANIRDLVAIEAIGKSHEGRDIWVVTVTNAQDRPGRGQAGVLGRRQHPRDRSRRVRRQPLLPAHAGHAIRQRRGRDARARHARVLRLSAHQSGRRRMGARRQAEVDPLQHAALSVRRRGHRGPDRRGHRRRRPHPADAHRRTRTACGRRIRRSRAC